MSDVGRRRACPVVLPSILVLVLPTLRGGVALAGEGPAAQGDGERDVEAMGPWPYEAPLVARVEGAIRELGSTHAVVVGGALTEEAVEVAHSLACVCRVVLLGGGAAMSPLARGGAHAGDVAGTSQGGLMRRSARTYGLCRHARAGRPALWCVVATRPRARMGPKAL